MTLGIGAKDPLAPDSLALIKGPQAALGRVYTSDKCFNFSPTERTRPGVCFFAAGVARTRTFGYNFRNQFGDNFDPVANPFNTSPFMEKIP